MGRVQIFETAQKTVDISTTRVKNRFRRPGVLMASTAISNGTEAYVEVQTKVTIVPTTSMGSFIDILLTSKVQVKAFVSFFQVQQTSVTRPSMAALSS